MDACLAFAECGVLVVLHKCSLLAGFEALCGGATATTRSLNSRINVQFVCCKFVYSPKGAFSFSCFAIHNALIMQQAMVLVNVYIAANEQNAYTLSSWQPCNGGSGVVLVELISGSNQNRCACVLQDTSEQSSEQTGASSMPSTTTVS